MKTSFTKLFFQHDFFNYSLSLETPGALIHAKGSLEPVLTFLATGKMIFRDGVDRKNTLRWEFNFGLLRKSETKNNGPSCKKTALVHPARVLIGAEIESGNIGP